MNKKVVFNKIKEKVEKRVNEIKKALNTQKESLKTTSSSTAGDKHNTSRAMMHIEEEKLTKQLDQLLQLKKLIYKVNPEKYSDEVTLGSLVETNKGWLFLAVPIGKIEIEKQNLMAISLASPVGQALKGKKAKDSTKFNNQIWEIISVC